jgi:dienelactone hydrolase
MDWTDALTKTQKDEPRLRERVVTVAFQGFGASRAQIAKYAGAGGLKLPGGAGRVTIAWAPLLLYNIYDHPELAEVGYGFTVNPLHWLTMLATSLKHSWDGAVGAPAHYLRFLSMEMAGETNVRHFLAAVRACVIDNPDKKIVLFGTSRGAATVFVGLARMPKELRERVAFAVLEGIPDSTDHVLEARSPFPNLSKALVRLLGLKTGSPLEVAGNYPRDVPTVFVTSAADKRVPSECSLRVIRALEERGLKPMHLELQNADHSSYSVHNPRDQMSYRGLFDYLYDVHIEAG